MTTQHHLPDHDPADDLENTRERIGDEMLAVKDFSSEEHGYHKRIAAAAAEREGHTGAFPVVAERPAIDHPPSSGTRDDE